jgi:hypothetical protein
MILTTSQLVENTLAFYDNMDDEAGNSYILSFILLRVGCVSKTYDFEQFLDMNREEKDQTIKENWSGKKVLMNLTSKEEEIEKNYKRFEAFFSTFSCLRFDDILRINNETNLKKIIQLLIDDVQSTIIEYRFTVLLARRIENLKKKEAYSIEIFFSCSRSNSSRLNYNRRSWTTK